VKVLSEVKAIRAWMLLHQKTLAFAESCTGGALSLQITLLPGASLYFLGSLVTYSNLLKEKILGISPKILEKHGAISEEVTKKMLEGVFKKTHAHYGIAVTGMADYPLTERATVPVGLVWYAMGRRETTPEVGALYIRKSREEVISGATQYLLHSFLKHLS